MRLSDMLRGAPQRADLAAAGGLVGGFVGGLAAGIAQAKRSPGAEDRRDGEHLRLLATATDVVFRYLPAPRGRFDYVSPSVEEVTGYTVEELYADTGLIRRLVHPDDWHVLMEAMRSEGQTASFELRWVCKTGEIVWVEQRVALVRDGGGRLVAVEGIARDVTARKEAEEALRQSEERHRALFETIAQGVIYYDAAGSITAANPAATDILGLTFDELRALSPLSRSWRAVREDGSDLPNEERPVEVALATGREVRGLVLGFRPSPGETRWICWNAVPQFRSGEDRPCGVHATLEDVTERKRAEHELREAEERFRVAFSHAPIGIAIVTLDGRYRQVNRAMCEILGYSEKELLGKTFKEITHPDDLEVSLDFERRLHAGEFETYHVEKRYVCADGNPVWASLNVSLVNGSRGEPLYYVAKVQDVSERKEWERAIAQSEERYRLVARATSEAIWDVNLPKDTLEWGGAAESLFGHSPDEPMNVAWWEERIHPEDRGRVLAGIDAVLQDGETWSDEYRFRRADGSYAVVADRGCVVRDDGGEPVRMIGSMLDVTERRRAEAALKESEERFRSLIQNSSDIITVVGEDGIILYQSPSMRRVLGHDPENRIGKDVFESPLVHPEDLSRHNEAMRETLRNTDAGVTVEIRMLRRVDGSWRHIEATMRNLIDEPSVRGIVLNARDITERRRAEAALRESEERFRLLAETTNDMVCLHKLDGRYLYVSPSSKRLLGYEPEELVGVDPYDLMHPEDVPRVRSGPQEDLLKGKPQVSTTCRYRKKSGDYAWFETVTGLVHDERGRVARLQTSSRDVSERKAAEEALEEAARAKTEFLADVSHELRTPLTVIRGNAEVGLQLRRDCVHKEGLEEIVRESGRVSRMVEDLLFLARADSSKVPPAAPFVPEPVPVKPFLAALAHRAELLARERGAILEATPSEDVEGTLQVDHIRIEQAVLALVDNAAKYGPEGGTVSLSFGLVDRGDRPAELRIEVSDCGPGIPEEELPHVFERFYRAGRSRNPAAGGGTGLGLSIARTIVEAQGGRIEARSQIGEGTRMTVRLPLADEARSTAEP